MILKRTKRAFVYNFSLLLKIMIAVFMIFLPISPQLHAQEPLRISSAAVENEIMSRFVLVHTVYEKRDFYHPEIIKEAEERNPLSSLCDEFVTDNYLHLDYLVKEEMVRYLKDKEESVAEPSAIVKNFSTFLTGSADFVAEMRNFFGLFLKLNGWEIENFVEKTRETFSFDELKAIAVRNVYPAKTPQGKLIYKICVAGEGYKDFPERNAHLEAFSFQTVFKAYDSETFAGLLEDCKSVAKSLYLSSEDDVHVERFQGCVWSFLFQDERFAGFLKKSYSQKKSYLPFIIAMPQDSH